jgi:hypothetical protein
MVTNFCRKISNHRENNQGKFFTFEIKNKEKISLLKKSSKKQLFS